MTVSNTSGVITTTPEDLPREVLPLTTEVNILYGVNKGTPFVVPPALDIERPVMQLHDFLTYRTSELRQYSLGKGFVVFVFDRPFPASTRKDIASDGGGPVASAGR